MNDLSVINSQNTQAVREAKIASLKASGKTVAYEKLPGLTNIGRIEVFDTIADARSTLAQAPGTWVIA